MMRGGRKHDSVGVIGSILIGAPAAVGTAAVTPQMRDDRMRRTTGAR